MSKRRKGYPSASRVKTGDQVVHGDKELTEKLGRNDPCPCAAPASPFKRCCLRTGAFDGVNRDHYF